jgi:proteasome assembly chaperone 2
MVVGLTSAPPALGSPRKVEAPLYPPFLPSAGLTRRLLQKLQEDGSPHGAVAAWCVEGDNRGDAMGLAGVVLGVLDLREYSFSSLYVMARGIEAGKQAGKVWKQGLGL